MPSRLQSSFQGSGGRQVKRCVEMGYNQVGGAMALRAWRRQLSRAMANNISLAEVTTHAGEAGGQKIERASNRGGSERSRRRKKRMRKG